MKKVFLVVVGVVVVAVAALLLFAATKPDSFRVERTVAINAPPQAIFPLVDDLSNFRKWSPWETKDPGMKREQSGPPRGVGATYAWEGNSDVGKGRMTIAESTPPAKVVYDLKFEEPFEAHHAAEILIAPAADGTSVTWSTYGPTPYITKVMTLFVSLDEMIGPDFEAGLASLKSLAER